MTSRLGTWLVFFILLNICKLGTWGFWKHWQMKCKLCTMEVRLLNIRPKLLVVLNY